MNINENKWLGFRYLSKEYINNWKNGINIKKLENLKMLKTNSNQNKILR